MGATSECLEARPDGLCAVDLRSHAFALPNMALPESIRGVFWIDAGNASKGYSNPWVDLNFLKPFPAGSSKAGRYWVMDATPRYQSWEDLPESVSYVKRIRSMGSRS